MARAEKRLTAVEVAKKTKPGMYPDGLGLYLRIGPTGAKSWIFRYRVAGGRREMGLGPVNVVTLADARERAASARKMRLGGVDPLQEREATRQAERLESARALTFRQCAESYIAAHAAGWRNAKHAAQWPSTLKTYVYPLIGDLPVAEIDTALVLRALEPIWTTKTETASRLRGRIEAVLDWATARQYRAGENPARWKGHLDKLLPARAKVQRIVHHPALPYDDMGAFMADLRGQDGTAARALEFQILTATRTGEVIGATWSEIDIDRRIWIIPGERMKAGREHRIPLSGAAVDVLVRMMSIREGSYVFSGAKSGKHLSNMALLMTLRRMKRDDLTAHGFRSTFRDWCAERTAYPSEVAEMALAHTVADRVEAAYRRGDLMEKRARLMEDWAVFCGRVQRGGEAVIPMRTVAHGGD
ncbi:MAG: integrase arm-type DNA-binding domain-containing protein [Magnetospirillum sp.]|nr:integrase arm-type DNA-binding domain-containing protein [Magnetospirillum sp.]